MSRGKKIRKLETVASLLETEWSIGVDDEGDWYAHIGENTVAGMGVSQYCYAASAEEAITAVLTAVGQAIEEKLIELQRLEDTLGEARLQVI